MSDHWQKFLGEAVGTGALIFVGAGSVLSHTMTGGTLGTVGIALAHGFVVLVMVYALGHISGAHINPAVTIAAVATRRMGVPQGVAFIVAQLAGAIVGAWLLTLAFPAAPLEAHMGAPALAAFVGRKAGFVLEAALTGILVWTIFGATDRKAHPAAAGVAIGLAVALGVLVAGPLTGAALNPARSFGPAFIANFWMNHWLYWAGPVVGALIAAFVYRAATSKE